MTSLDALWGLGLTMQQRQTFDQVADFYADVRPGYPSELFDELSSRAGLGGASAVLEVGCGAGQATRDLVTRAGRVVALDPGERLIAAARQRITAANVEFVVTNFESAVFEPATFDLVVSAQAWHWIDPKVAFRKAAAALAPRGFLVVFGHVPMRWNEPFLSAFKSAFDIYLPGVWGTPPPQTAYLPSGPFAGQFVASGLFEPAIHRAYDWTWTLDSRTLGRYLRTESGYHRVPETQRFALFDAMATSVADNGDRMDWAWQTHLYLAAPLNSNQ
jgi:SAM-dependent methyltransferase